MIPDTNGGRIGRRLVQACLLALGVVVFVFAVEEVRYHRKIVQWHALGVSITDETGYPLLGTPSPEKGYLSVDSLLPTSVINRLPLSTRLTWFVRPGHLSVHAKDAELTTEILRLAEDANLRAVSVQLSTLDETHLDQIADLRTVRTVQPTTTQVSECVSRLNELPNLTRVTFRARRITPAGLKALEELPPHVQLTFVAGYIPEAETVRRIQHLRSARHLKIRGGWRFRYE